MQRYANNKSLLSGSELQYDPDYWNSLENLESLNCYDYAYGNADPEQKVFSQPLDKSPVDNLYTCASVEDGMMRDHPSTTKVSFEVACPQGERKIALMVDPVHPSDYHYMRQDADGIWSHKPGYLPVRRIDGSGKVIFAPHLSNRDYGSFNYSTMCGYYCVPSNINFGR